MAGRSDNKQNSLESYQQIEIDSMKLAVTVFQLVKVVNNGFKFTLGDSMTKSMMSVGTNIRRAVKYVSTAQKVKYLKRAKDSLDDLDFAFEVALFGNILNPEEKAKYDIEQGKVSGQLSAFLNSQRNKLANARRSPDGNASGVNSE